MILLVVFALALALISVSAFLGRWVWWLDVAANFRAQYVVALALLGLLIAMSRWRKTGYAILAVALVNLIAVLPLFVGSPADPSPEANDLRVMSYNLLSTNESYSTVIEYIQTIDPDLVLLHEASRPWEVAVESAELDYQIIRPRSDELIFGTLVLVKGEDVEAVSYGFASAAPRAVSVEFVPDGWNRPVTALGIHPLAPTDEERAALRNAQIGFAADWAAGQTGAFLVAGDFNATPWSWSFRRLLDEGELHNSQVGFGLQPSFSTESNLLLRVPIDHLVHSASLEVTGRHLGPAMGSDHFPLIVDLQVAG